MASRWQIELDDTTSDKVLFATVAEPDGNAITVVEVREGRFKYA